METVEQQKPTQKAKIKFQRVSGRRLAKIMKGK
jgi:hypothetical protein